MSDSYLGKEVAGQFRIVEKIGKGGMGAVYKAEQPDMNRYVAIKILHSRYLSRSDLVSRFRREARAMSQLSHPNTARVFLYGQLDDGACYNPLAADVLLAPEDIDFGKVGIGCGTWDREEYRA